MEWLQALHYKFWITRNSITSKVVFFTLMGPLFCIAFDSWSVSRTVRWFFVVFFERRCYDYKEKEIKRSYWLAQWKKRSIPYSFYFGRVFLHLFILLCYFGFLTIFMKFVMILCLFLFAGVRIVLMEFI